MPSAPDPGAVKTGHAHLKGGATLVLVPARRPDGRLRIEARVGSGALVGHCEFDRNPDGSWSGADLYVDPGWRLRGVATAIYDHVEKAGLAIVPSTDPDEDGAAFWEARRAAKTPLPGRT
jgi:GNAT superfamily N-acetyltransferase